MELKITVQTITELDYDDVSVTEKNLTSTIDGIDTTIVHSEASSVIDATAKTNYKNKLTELGYTWTSEI